jgi:glycosyltransferase involved in cell wall biosynthesis
MQTNGSNAVSRVLDQQKVNLEPTVIDDGSTDHSIDIIKSFGNQVRWKTGTNRGACGARNCGLDLASARFIIFLDADDYIEPDSIVDCVVLGKGADLTFGPFAYEIGGRRTLGRPLLGIVKTDSIFVSG